MVPAKIYTYYPPRNIQRNENFYREHYGEPFPQNDLILFNDPRREEDYPYYSRNPLEDEIHGRFSRGRYPVEYDFDRRYYPYNYKQNDLPPYDDYFFNMNEHNYRIPRPYYDNRVPIALGRDDMDGIRENVPKQEDCYREDVGVYLRDFNVKKHEEILQEENNMKKIIQEENNMKKKMIMDDLEINIIERKPKDSKEDHQEDTQNDEKMIKKENEEDKTTTRGQKKNRIVCSEPKSKKTKKRAPRNNWKKMTKELFYQMVEYERDHPNVKQCDLQKIFNVNRSTYWRWKKQNNMI